MGAASEGGKSAVITTNDLQNGMTIEVDGEVYEVVEFLHVKPGKGQAFVRTKLRHLGTGTVINKVFPAGQEIKEAEVERRKAAFLYRDGSEFVFMDDETYDEIRVGEGEIGRAKDFLKEDLEVDILVYEGKIIGVEPPLFVDLKVVETEPGVRGDTKAGGSKPAKLESGLVVQVPLFINEGDVVRVDTRTGEYVERVEGGG